MRPSEKVVPTQICRMWQIMKERPAKTTWMPNRAGARNRNVNSIGSVMPVRNEVMATEKRREPAIFFFSGLAQVYIAKAAPGRPPIMNGYLPVRKRQASAEKWVVFGSASWAKKMFCAPSIMWPSIIMDPPTPVCQKGR